MSTGSSILDPVCPAYRHAVRVREQATPPARRSPARIASGGRCAVLLAAALVVTAVWFMAGVIAHQGAAGRTAMPSHAHRREAAGTRLPLAAQGPVSRVLGRDDPSYRAVAVGGRLAVRSARQHLRVLFDRRGVVIRSGTAVLGLRLRAYGYRNGLHAVGATRPLARANKVSYRHTGVTEWYVNGPLGLEQGFTLGGPPRGPPGWSADVVAGGVGKRARDALPPRGCGDLHAARGVAGVSRPDRQRRARRAAARADRAARRRACCMRVDDRGARYPLRIDPFVQQAKLTASDGGATDELGLSVAVSGDTVVAGASGATVNGHAARGRRTCSSSPRAAGRARPRRPS